MGNESFFFHYRYRKGCCTIDNFSEVEHEKSLPHVCDEMITCKHCRARKFPKETAGFCCGEGTVQLEDLKEPPEEIKDLIVNNAQFKKNIRKYV